jgi:hypothetical protein
VGIDTIGSGAYRQRPPPRRGSRKAVAIVGTDAKRLAGKRLKAFVLDRMAVVGIATLVELSAQADIAYDTLHRWFRGLAPAPRAGGKVAATLKVAYTDLLAAYEGTTQAGGRFVKDDELVALVEEAVARALARETAEDPRDIRIRRAHAAPLHRRHDDPQ